MMKFVEIGNDNMDEIERELKKDIMKHMNRLSSQMKLFKDMRGAHAFKRSLELYEDLSRIYIKLNGKEK